MYRLLFQDRRAPRPPFVAREATVVIGRDPACQLRLTDNGVSDRHASIERRADGYYLRDLGSAVGVRVNGAAVAEQCLASGDELEIGAVRIRFEFMHEAFTQGRRMDLLQLLAATVIAVTLLGQVGVLGWVFSQDRPRHMRTDMTRGGRVPQKTVKPSEADKPKDTPRSLPTEPLSGVTTPGVGVNPVRTEAEPAVLNQFIKLTRVDRADAADGVTLMIQAKAQVGERELDAAAVGISVQFLTSGAAGRAAAWLEPVWVSVGRWENFATKTFVARFAGSPTQLAGYVVRSYYRRQLQSIRAEPVSLETAAPEPKL